MGRHRRLDYILADSSIPYVDAGATDELDLGSDHRAVFSNFRLQGDKKHFKSAKVSHKNIDWDVFQNTMANSCCEGVSSLDTLEGAMLEAARNARIKQDSYSQPQDLHLRRLRKLRRAARDSQERRNLSKQISKYSRQDLRRQKNMMVKQQLVEWRDLQKLDIFNRAPVVRKATKGPDLRLCADLLEGVFKSDVGVHISEQAYEPIDFCTPDEVFGIIKRMRKKRASDRIGIIMEMFLFGGQPVWDHLAHFFNQIILTGSIPEGWRESFFILLHKGGATNDANNWRPIAILRIAYKIFARLLHTRIKGTLEAAQSDEQYGFRPGRSTTDALLIAETVISRSLEYNFDVWMVSIDLRKAFDRVEQDALFSALEAQGLDASYRYLLQQIYKDQIGILSEDISFGIDRGVRQGDILSPMLFNCILEKALTDWKTKIKSCGFYLEESFNQEPLTNIRFADDLLVLGRL